MFCVRCGAEIPDNVIFYQSVSKGPNLFVNRR